MPTVLAIDDNQAICNALQVLFSLRGIDTLCASSPDEGLALLAREPVDLVVQDMNFSADTTSGDEGVELFRRIRGRHPDLPVILLTAWTHLETAVELVRAGAADYLAKPWDDDKLLTAADNLIALHAATREQRRLQEARHRSRATLAGRYDLCGLIYESDAMQQLVSVATQVAHAEVPVLITGPNGVGKEKIADLIQANSAVREGPYVKVNVGALPAELMESELFGAEAGAYTGATRSRAGRFEAADGGTLFLDEIGELPLSGQVKLLRVLQTGEFSRLGSNETRRVQVRVISATNSDLGAAIEAGEFREDLYYRLNVIELAVPPLADRRDDILPLAHALLPAGTTISRSLEQSLLAYPWPGNVRELQNRLARALLLAGERPITAADLGLPQRADARPAAAEPDRDAIADVLNRTDWVIAEAAEELGLSRQALYRRIEKYGLQKT
ncbi:MAG TPA: sigma-54 dependent transcriptional regulator [Gammaproteobacteria bacterium]|nr:sigma-54 dependent transcriptional regulator [Gammaproteobacteria bacterium]